MCRDKASVTVFIIKRIYLKLVIGVPYDLFFIFSPPLMTSQLIEEKTPGDRYVDFFDPKHQDKSRPGHTIKHRCKTCGKVFYDARNLQQHMQIHLPDKPFSCSKCDRNYRMEESLRIHMTTHDGQERSYCCEVEY